MKRRGSTSKRRIVVGENTYTWHVGRSYVEVREIVGDGSRTFVRASFEQVTGLTPDDVERGIWKRWLAITPSMIEKLIRNEWVRISAA